MGTISVKSVTQLNVVLDNVPGALAKVAGSFASGGINIEGICRTQSSDSTVMERFVVDQVDAAKKALGSLGNTFTEEKILSLWCVDQPGIIAKVAKAFGDAGINIENMYSSSAGKMKDTVLYVGVSSGNFAKAEGIAKGL
jgi:hypothetical protein